MQLVNIFLPDFDPIFIGFLPIPPDQANYGRDRFSLPKEERLLAALLAERFLGKKPQHLLLTCGRLGQPQLRLNGAPGPTISFSRGGGQLWAGLTAVGTRLGIDVASPEEFIGNYPYRKVFGGIEWRMAAALMGGNLPEAAALLWSVKEAAAKAISCGFHFFGPRQVGVDFKAGKWPGLLWKAQLPALPPDGAFLDSPSAISGGSWREKNGVWVSVAGEPAAEEDIHAPRI